MHPIVRFLGGAAATVAVVAALVVVAVVVGVVTDAIRLALPVVWPAFLVWWTFFGDRSVSAP